MTTEEIKGFVDVSHVCLTSEKFKGFNYNEDCEKTFNLDFNEVVKIEAEHFKNIIDFLNKADYESFNIKRENNELLIYRDCLNSFSFKIPLVNYEGESEESLYSVEYLHAFLKQFKKKELKGEFIEFSFSGNNPIFCEIKELNKSVLIAPRVEDNDSYRIRRR